MQTSGYIRQNKALV